MLTEHRDTAAVSREAGGRVRDDDRRLPMAIAQRDVAGDGDGMAERYGASRAESLASTDFGDLRNPDQVREIDALMRHFARRMKRLRLRREARRDRGRRIDLQGTVRAQRGERRHAVPARVEGPPPRPPASRADRSTSAAR